MAMLSAHRSTLPAAPLAAGIAAAPTLSLHPPQHPERASVEEFVQRVYHRRYGAVVTDYAPMLVSLRDADGTLLAAAGYRRAEAGPLFLERYLPQPVESLLAPHAGRPLQRSEVVEVGHLAAARAGAGRRLMFELGPHLAQLRFRWTVATLTRELREMMVRLGITPLALAPADPALLGEDATPWGSYYAHQPMVLAGELQPALRRLAHRSAAMTGVPQ